MLQQIENYKNFVSPYFLVEFDDFLNRYKNIKFIEDVVNAILSLI
jgi:hypothetical protein